MRPELNPVDWLLEGGAHVRYRTLVDVIGLGEDDAAVRQARMQVSKEPGIQRLMGKKLFRIGRINGWCVDPDQPDTLPG